jgi:hypothetical protein
MSIMNAATSRKHTPTQVHKCIVCVVPISGIITAQASFGLLRYRKLLEINIDTVLNTLFFQATKHFC